MVRRIVHSFLIVFATWIGGYPVGSLNGFTDDADNDGLDNGVENFLGTNPSITNPGVSQVSLSGSTLSFQHPQNATPASDIAASYLWSTDLVMPCSGFRPVPSLTDCP